MKHKNISIFVPHAGCPHRCSFCDQCTITAQQNMPSPAEVQRICQQAFGEIEDRQNTQIAFFGGSFTAIPAQIMTGLLEAAQPFLGTDGFAGIRISTRPDCISEQILDVLKHYGVKAIELGAQSMDDTVLSANRRGHDAQDVCRASALIREKGFELGLQVMPGLYGSTPHLDMETMRKICSLHPDTVRIYPVVILRGTELAAMYEAGSYQPYSFEKMTELVAAQMEHYMAEGIRVIKVGLHASEFVQADAVGGYYHPAFRELCEGMIYRKRMEQLFDGCSGVQVAAVHPSCISKAIGQKKANIIYFAERYGITLKVTGDRNVPEYQVINKESACF